MMVGLVLAGGEGSRLLELGVPKPLVDVAGQPLVVRAVRMLADVGCAPIGCLVRAPWAAAVAEQLAIAGGRAVVTACDTPSSLHTLALGLRGATGPVLATMVDTVMVPGAWRAFREGAETALAGGAEIVLGVTCFVDDERPLYVTWDDQGRVTLGEPASGSDWVTAGVYAFSPAVAARAEAALALGIERMRGFLSWASARGSRFAVVPLPAVVDVDRRQDVEAASLLLDFAGEAAR